MKTRIFLLALALLLVGCGSAPKSEIAQGERGPSGTIAYHVPVDSSEPGARIEVNGETVGVTPMTLKIFGDKDGSFHNFGSYDFIVRAYPPGDGRPSHSKVFKTGAMMAHEDKIPPKIYFDFGPKPQLSNP